MQPRRFVHEYLGFGGVHSHCRFIFTQTVTGIKACIADELPSNSGTHIRDFADHLATHAYRELFAPNGTHIGDFLYIEHAPRSEASLEYSYDLVEFDWDDEGMRFINPRRTMLTDEEVAVLLGESYPAELASEVAE